MCYLFDILIKPVYGLWFTNMELCYIRQYNDSLKIIRCKLCKFTLGVSTNAINLAQLMASLDALLSQYAESSGGKILAETM